MLQAPLPGPAKPVPLAPGSFQDEATPEEGAGVVEEGLRDDSAEGQGSPGWPVRLEWWDLACWQKAPTSM